MDCTWALVDPQPEGRCSAQTRTPHPVGLSPWMSRTVAQHEDRRRPLGLTWDGARGSRSAQARKHERLCCSCLALGHLLEHKSACMKGGCRHGYVCRFSTDLVSCSNLVPLASAVSSKLDLPARLVRRMPAWCTRLAPRPSASKTVRPAASQVKIFMPLPALLVRTNFRRQELPACHTPVCWVP